SRLRPSRTFSWGSSRFSTNRPITRPTASPPATASAAPVLQMIATRTIGASSAPMINVKRKASSSDLSGLIISVGPLEDVDGAPHDDPHHVDEVPVDPGALDTHVGVGREVAA